MTLDLTFREVRDFVDKRHSALINAVDSLLGVVLARSSTSNRQASVFGIL